MDFGKLYKVDEQLAKGEVEALKFLCMDHLGIKRLENVKDAKHLFLQLSEQELLSDPLFLHDLLYTIGRYDLLSKLDTNKTQVSRSLEIHHSGVSLYRKMLYNLSENVTDEILHNIKFLLNDLPKGKLTSATFLDVLSEMEKMEMLGENNLDKLEYVLSKCSKELANRVQKFRNTSGSRSPVCTSVPAQEESMLSASEEEENLNRSVQPEDELMNLVDKMNRSRYLSGSESVDTDSQAEELPAEISPNNASNMDDCYPMTRRPLGYCLIINNHTFHKKLGVRRGTDVDRDKLTEVFSKMHFQVEERRDLSSEGMTEAVNDFSLRDHSKMDAFVCCILSHGNKGTVLGTDEEPVLIRDIIQPFTSCSTLLGKPKLFFIQACQGIVLQKGVWRQDGTEDDECEEDAVQAPVLCRIAVEADFLIGMSTVESYKSFRHTTHGSVFIQELCKHLNNGCREKEDILSILTKVNRSVSAQDLNRHKQMPEPRYTLTKKLVLPLD